MRAWAAVVAFYVVGAVVFTFPMPLSLDSAVWGDRFDAWTTMWLIDHLARGGLTEVTDAIFYPEGYNLWSFGHLGIQALGVPLMWLGLSATATYNLLLLGAFSATGVAAHALGLRLSGSHAGGLVAGVLFAFNPYTYGEMSAGCVELVGAWFIPLYVLALIRICDDPTWKRALVAAVVLALTGPFNWYYTAFLAMFTGAFVLWRLLAGGERRVRAVTWIVVVAVAAAVSNVPLVLEARRETPSRSPITAETFSLESRALVAGIPDGSTPLEDLDAELLELNDAMQVGINSTSLTSLLPAGFPPNPLESTPGRLAFVVGAVGLALSGRRGRPWALLAAGFGVLTLGPYLLIDATPPLPDWSLSNPLPYKGLYNHVPFFAKAYRPYRLGVVVLVCLAALASTGWSRLGLQVRWGLAAVVALIGITQPHWTGVSSRPLADASIPAVYDELAALPAGAVIELPLHYQPVTPANARYQYNQVAHGQPLLNCNQLIRRTDLARFQAYVGGNAFLSTVLDLGRREAPYTFAGEDLDALADTGFRYVVAHTAFESDPTHLAGFQGRADRLRQPAWDMLRSTLGEPVLVGEDGTWVFELPERNAPGPRVFAGTRWEDVSLPWVELRLPVTLGAAPLSLETGSVERLSFWVERLGGEGELLVVADGTSTQVATRRGAWTWVEVEVSSADLALHATDDLRVRLDGIQVERITEVARR
ncbi:MAG: DUF3367 domain-containing protein [Proteobacteria bacterium]|nr:DUF3367 domain-containing protein [Pseudomonadota bacterium]MCP4915651.1 DUF3367 domain-containing protein [Pseudomonadota bacterium]